MSNKILDLAERAGWTAVQSFVGALTASSLFVSHVDVRQVLVAAAVAAGASALKVLGVNVSVAALVQNIKSKNVEGAVVEGVKDVATVVAQVDNAMRAG